MALALFRGDVAFDVALRVARFPEPDEKTHAFENLAGGEGQPTRRRQCWALY
ncbi:hypothetical protein ABT075_33135 [Streptomyces sp. NPDC002677]|uniref:hypothetical protein n=1 Tax=Streptomyces sp. NPDC002677 TaxID=3154774 RepID=UPI003329D1EC